jgi:hypothetical protein
MMDSPAVRLRVQRPPRMARVHVFIRLALLVALGAVGCSSLYWGLYLVLPVVAALLVSSKSSDRYLTENAPKIVRGLRWLAAAYAYLWLLTDAWPTEGVGGQVELQVEARGAPTLSSAMLRLLYSLPALLLLAALSIVAGFLWIVGALAILLSERLPAAIAEFLALTLRYQFGLAAYHLSLTDRYPSLATPVSGVRHSGAA